ncbi:hypothetical protein N180_02745 [Pedobacter antarcticus 4BY]|uniref:Uncharacterized protein n=1 Tax=Pedobacter antarcticus 4BY TaxID=1358423 RepID=A0A081PKG0_9SPHI|nr:hypothetical protein N180_02745 [Pedobacter antarcticus 4BY]
MIGSYRKYFKCSREEVMNMSWINFIMDLASIPDTSSATTKQSEQEKHISPEDEAAELRKDLGI